MVPGDLAFWGEEFGGGADEVGDDSVEVCGAGGAGGGLGYGAVGARGVVPGGRGARGSGFLGQAVAVPGEVDGVGGGAVGCQAGFGCAAAGGVVGVRPAGAVRGDCLGEAVVGVPGVGPGAALAVEQAAGAADQAALGVVGVGGAAGAVQEGAGLTARRCRSRRLCCRWGRRRSAPSSLRRRRR